MIREPKQVSAHDVTEDRNSTYHIYHERHRAHP